MATRRLRAKFSTSPLALIFGIAALVSGCANNPAAEDTASALTTKDSAAAGKSASGAETGKVASSDVKGTELGAQSGAGGGTEDPALAGARLAEEGNARAACSAQQWAVKGESVRGWGQFAKLLR